MKGRVRIEKKRGAKTVSSKDGSGEPLSKTRTKRGKLADFTNGGMKGRLRKKIETKKQNPNAI